MLFKNKIHSCVAMLALSASFSSVAEETVNADIDALLDQVSDSKTERSTELKKLEHLDKKLKHVASIKKSQLAIEEFDNTDSSTTQEVVTKNPKYTELESLIAQELTNEPKQRGNSSSRGGRFKKKVSLISLWGNPKNPKADIVFNGRHLEIGLKSNLNGWEVMEISKNYLLLKKGSTETQVYYSEPEAKE